MLEKQAFVSYQIDSERDKPKRDIFSVSLNPKERVILDRFKKESNITHDSKAKKVLAMCGANVMNGVLGSQILRYLSSEDRTKTVQ